ncbi:VOC family protein [Streptomyces sp. NPDC053367]|uniref:VOC family protein n=1 Tax=Streptomyces sp. NPDC053367 TaxID=3365700 RepID=UPI0037D7A362
MSVIQPVILTARPDVLLGFYTKLFGAEEFFRVPEEGPAFYLGLRVGDTDLGLVAKEEPGTEAAPRILLSIGVDDVDDTLGRVEALGGSVGSGPKDMPWGQRVAHIKDPDGNPVNLTQPIPARRRRGGAAPG